MPIQGDAIVVVQSQLRETSRAITNELGTEGGTGEYVRGEQEMCKRCREAFGVGPRRTLREEPVTARDDMGSQRNDDVKTTPR